MSLIMMEVETSQLMNQSTLFVLLDLKIRLTKFLRLSTTQDTQDKWTLEHSSEYLASMEILTVNPASNKFLMNLTRMEKEFSELLSLKRQQQVLANILPKLKLIKSFNMLIKIETEELLLKNSYQLSPKFILKFDQTQDIYYS